MRRADNRSRLRFADGSRCARVSLEPANPVSAVVVPRGYKRVLEAQAEGALTRAARR
jgi:hypothetical protein